MVFENLFRNCATHAGETPVVEVSVERSGNETRITVRDDGPGIAPPLRGQLFERGAVSAESAGLGLYLVKRIVEMHGGTVELVDEEERDGCGFLITLPSDKRVELT
jgi:signal transduction histidine kinase